MKTKYPRGVGKYFDTDNTRIFVQSVLGISV